MSLTESIIEEVTLEWFLFRQGYGGQVGEMGLCGRARFRIKAV
jgi:hypothetical protein